MFSADFLETLFDAEYYLAHNADVALSGLDPWDHFRDFGQGEGRDPSRFFNTAYYLQENPDVAASGLQPLQHFLDFGLAEERIPTPLFDADYYLSANPDISLMDAVPFEHFVRSGMTEGQLPEAEIPGDQPVPPVNGAEIPDSAMQLLGTENDDLLVGGSGDDVLVGFGGDDMLTGGQGSDIFGFNPNFGHDTITDFQLGEDILRLKSYGIGNYDDLTGSATISVAEDSTMISFQDGSSVTLVGVTDPNMIDFMPLPIV